AHIDRAAKRDRQPWLQVESVELVDDGDVVEIGGPRGAVRQRQMDATAGQLARIGDGESITRKRALVGVVQVERRERAGQAMVFEDFQIQAASPGTSSHGADSQ